MAQYTSTREGFQRAMEESLAGPPEDSKQYAESTAMPDFYHVMNGQLSKGDDYVKGLAEWRGKISEYKPIV